jgi:hypothetical protein
VAKNFMRKKISTGVVGHIDQISEERCGGAVVEEVKINLVANSQSMKAKTTRKRTKKQEKIRVRTSN